VHQNAPKCTKTHHFFDFFSLLSDRLTLLRASPHLVLRLVAEAATPVGPTPRGAVLSRTLFLNSNITDHSLRNILNYTTTTPYYNQTYGQCNRLFEEFGKN